MAKREQATSANKVDPPVVIVGIGAALGDALRSFLGALPSDSTMAFVLVTDQTDSGDLTAKLGKSCPLPVLAIKNHMAVAPGKLYVAPAQAIVTIKNGRLRVSRSKKSDTPIDLFLNSLAEDRGTAAIGVILSGAGSDGALGLRAIAELGGMTMAQDEASADNDSMPHAAAANSRVDHIMPPQQLAAEILRYAEHLSTSTITRGPAALPQQIEHALPAICDSLQQISEHDFRHYKSTTLVRRVEWRMQVLKLADVNAYLERLGRDKEEANRLFKELLVGVTAFFRNTDAFAALEREVIPKLFAGRADDEPVRIWVPGCASGEEAYSIAILLREHMDGLDSPPEIQIFATDIDEHALDIARRGSYPLGIAESLSSEQLRCFFKKKGQRYRVARKIREMCLFSHHNLISDPPLSQLDLISCRNLLIYLGPHLQKKLIPLFHQSLRPGGYLFLGPTENLISHQALFEPISAKHRISRSKPTDSRGETLPMQRPGRRTNLPPSMQKALDDEDLQQIAQRIVLDEFAPKYAVVNDAQQILYVSDGTAKYLEMGEGLYTNNIVRLARSGLRAGLRTALQTARSKRRRVERFNLSVPVEGGIQPLSLTVQPMPQLGEASGIFIVVFQDAGTVLDTKKVQRRKSSDQEESVAESMIQQLQNELETIRSDLEKTVQDLEAANEELKSSNDELRTLNEEYQSANEELETSKDEIQSAAEALEKANSDLENLLRSTDIATLFLDEQLTIQLFTPAAAKIYNLIERDVGRPLAHLTHRLKAMPDLPTLTALADAETTLETEVESLDGRYYLRRVSAYRGHTGTIQGLVLTFTDITELRTSEERFRLLLNSTAEAIYGVDLDGNCTFCNAACAKMLGYQRPEDLIGKHMHTLIHHSHEDQTPYAKEDCPIYKVMHGGEGINVDNEVFWRADNTPLPVIYWSYPMHQEGQLIGAVVTFLDISQRREAERVLRRQASLLELSYDAIMVWREEPGVIEFWNRGAEALYGYSEDEALGQVIHELLNTLHPKPLADIQAEMASRGQWEGELIQQHKKGYRVIVSSRHQLVQESNGERLVFEINRDISDRKQFEQSMREAQQAAEAANLSKSQFLANMSHEIRTPMTAILGYADVLAAQLQDDATIEYVDTIKRNGRYLLDIVNDILDLSKIEAGKLDLHQQICSPVELVADVRSLMEVRAQEKRLPLRVEYETAIPETISTDPVRLRQILINLLSNAIKFTDHGYVKLSVRYLDKHDPPWIQFIVRDTGIGISAEQQKILFQPFTQVDSSHTRQYGGTGLGLAICWRLAQMLGGEITLQSAPRQGSTLTLSVPAGLSDAATLVEPSSEIMADLADSPATRPRINGRLLVVDDRHDIRSLAKHFLEAAGAFVEVAENGQAAIDAIAEAERQQQDFDVVIMDMQMPVLDGYQATARLRERGFERPIIALTAGAMQGEREKCLQAGCNEFISKPIEGYRLVGAVARYAADSTALTQAETLAPKATAGNAANAANAVSESNSSCRILIVDDSKDASSAMSKLLGMLRHEVQLAHSGQSAIDAAHAFQPQAIILDIHLPDMDGYEVASRLKQSIDFEQTVLIALSGSDPDANRLKEAGFDHYLLKPASINELLPLLPLRNKCNG